MSLYKSLTAFFLICLFASCKKDGQIQIENNFPGTPITVANVYAYRPTPSVSTSKAAGGTITITLQAPSGKVIKEITKVAAATTYTTVQSATTVGTSGLYVAGPIAGNNSNQITFTTSIAEYAAKTGTSATPASNAELGRQFYFMVTMSDGEVIVTEPVRVVVLD